MRRRLRAALTGKQWTPDLERFWQEVHRRHPPFWQAVLADARITAANRGERSRFRSRAEAAFHVLRLALVTDAFLALCCYRAKAACQRRGIPLLPRLLHRLAIVTGQVSIGDPVVVEPGVYLPHGQVVVDGIATIGSGAWIGPFVTIGLVTGEMVGPTIGRRVRIGAGATIVGPVTVGRRAVIGAGSVVVSDVPPRTTVAGVPAKPLTAA